MPQASPDESTSLERRVVDAVEHVSDADGSASTLGVVFDRTGGQPWTSWDTVPRTVRALLAAAGYVTDRPFVAGAVPAGRDGSLGGGHLAWAVTNTGVVVVELPDGTADEPDAGRPGGPEPAVRIRPIIGSPRRRIGVVPVDAAASATARRQGSAPTPGVLDVLPAVVRRHITEAVPEPDVEHEALVQSLVDDLPRQQDAVLVRMSVHRVVAVSARRTVRLGKRPSRERAERDLARADWHVDVLVAEVGPEQAGRSLPGFDARPAMTPRREAIDRGHGGDHV